LKFIITTTHSIAPFELTGINIKMKGSHSAVLAVAALARCVSGHAFFQQASKGSTDYGTKCTRVPVWLTNP